MPDLVFLRSRLSDVDVLKARQDIKGLIRLMDHQNGDIQLKSIEALGALGSIATLPLLAELNSRNPLVRIGAIEALGIICDQRSCNPLICLLEHDENPEVRWVAALVLGTLNNPDATGPLVHGLRDKDRYVRYGAAQALRMLSWYPGNETEQAYFFIALHDWETVTRIGAPATGPLIEILNDQNAKTREEIVTVLGNIGDSQSQRACEKVLMDSNRNVRWNAVIAAKKCGVDVSHLPWWLSRRPRSGQNPWAAAILNFLFIGLGYSYLGYWWGFLVFMSYSSLLVLSQLQLGPFVPYLIAYPVTALFAVQTFYLAQRKETM